MAGKGCLVVGGSCDDWGLQAFPSFSLALRRAPRFGHPHFSGFSTARTFDASHQHNEHRQNMSLNFEDLCLDPFQANFDDGHREGSEAGLLAGYNEGRKLGQQKAVEVGIELGYMRGVAEAIIRQSIVTPNAAALGVKVLGADDDAGAALRKIEKIKKSADELLSMIDAFPSPDEIFQQAIDDGSEEKQLSHDEGDDSNAEENGDSEEIKGQSGGPVDISGRMQRIRAKFKLLCVQLKMPEISLSRVMEDAKKNAGESNAMSNSKEVTGSNPSQELASGGNEDW